MYIELRTTIQMYEIYYDIYSMFNILSTAKKRQLFVHVSRNAFTANDGPQRSFERGLIFSRKRIEGEDGPSRELSHIPPNREVWKIIDSKWTFLEIC